jgi:hypothetical protein
MNAYLISYTDGTSIEIEADGYEQHGDEMVFFSEGAEVLRAPSKEISALTKTSLR